MQTDASAAPRYRCLDEYTSLEVQKTFELGDSADQIAVMRSVFDAGSHLPYEVALAAASSADVSVRLWLARNARELKYYDREDSDESPTNLWTLLEKDPEPLVRLAVHENQYSEKYAYHHPSPKDFQELTHAERLAAIRNPRMAANGVPDVVLAIFDTTDTSVTSSLDERRELALAYLSNEVAVRQSHDFDYPHYIRYDPVSYTFEKEREKLWHLAATFPGQSVRWYGLRFLGAKDEWKAAVYSQLQTIQGDDQDNWENQERANLRLAILHNCSDRDTRTLALGVKDRDENCHATARQKYLGYERTRSRFRRVAGHAWTVILELVALLVIVAILNAADTRFEKIVIGGIIYLFLTVTTLSMQIFATYRSASLAIDAQFQRLKTLVGEKLTSDEAEVYAQQREEIRQSFAKANVNYITSSIILFFAWLATLVVLLGALF